MVSQLSRNDMTSLQELLELPRKNLLGILHQSSAPYLYQVFYGLFTILKLNIFLRKDGLRHCIFAGNSKLPACSVKYEAV